LQSIFVPLMSIVWVYGSEQIGKYVNYIQQQKSVTASLGVEEDEKGKQSKKRKRKAMRVMNDEGGDDGQENSSSSYNPLVRYELHETSRWILEAVRLCCVHDNIHFIDQVTSNCLSFPLSVLFSSYISSPYCRSNMRL
jgi:hypothetical protein